MRDLRQQRVDASVPGLAPQPRFDRRRGPIGPLRFEQHVDVDAISTIGRDSAGGRMRLLNVALVLEPRENAPNGRGRHTQTGRCDEHGRSHRFASGDVLADERGQHQLGPIVGFH